jgi:hypothetical protein
MYTILNIMEVGAVVAAAAASGARPPPSCRGRVINQVLINGASNHGSVKKMLGGE